MSKPADQRKALLRGLTTQLIREGRVTTTKARAKALRNEAERMISLAKEGSLASRRRAIGYIYDKKLVHSLFEKAKERYGDRKGGDGDGDRGGRCRDIGVEGRDGVGG